MAVKALSRRSVLRGFGLTAVAAAAGYAVARRSDAASAPASPSAANAYGAVPAPASEVLTRLDAVPAGGGIVLERRKLVITRDRAGTVRAFSAVCTHQGCTVGSVRGGEIECPCHGSRFDAATGARVRGPATQPLREVAVVVRDGDVVTS
jgi:Rieske Fe-S protein